MFRMSLSRFARIIITISLLYGILQLRSIINAPKKLKNSPVSNITIWSNDFHISPIKDIKHQLASLNVRFIDKSLSGHCHITKTCQQDLKILNKDNGISPNPKVRQQFYNAYKNDLEMNQVHAFICFHPAAMCELFMPFNRALIIIASTRYEFGRYSKEEWTNWNKNLQTISSNPRNVIAANNLYDAEYIRYFTGIKPMILPSLCDYTNASYMPKIGSPFLIAPIYGKTFSLQFTSILNNSLHRLKTSVTFGHLKEVYPEYYEYSKIVSHPGIIYVPYQVSTMSLFEQYRMNMPLFFPSLELLTKWHHTCHIIEERTWNGVHGDRKNASILPGVLGSDIPDPNNEFDQDAIRYWLQFSDFYQWPYITYFSSIEELAVKLTTTNLTQISENMRKYNANLRKNLWKQWRQILGRIASSTDR